MFLRIDKLPQKHFAGLKKKTSISAIGNTTFELWSNFMPQKNKIMNRTGTEFYSIVVYPESYFTEFNMDALFEKWAAVEVSSENSVPSEFEALTSNEGKYAVFVYKGLPSDGAKFYQSVYNDWLPNSQYEIDVRPHLSIMGEKYKNDSPDSEEELWVPIK